MEDHPLRCKCGQVLDGGTNTKELAEHFMGTAPAPFERKRMERIPGAIVVCWYCAGVSHFTQTGVLVPMSPFEFQKLPREDRRAVRATQEAIKASTGRSRGV